MTPKPPIAPRSGERDRSPGRARPPIFGRFGRRGGPRPGAIPDWTTPFPKPEAADGDPAIRKGPGRRLQQLTRRLLDHPRRLLSTTRLGLSTLAAAVHRFRAWLSSWIPKSPALRAVCALLAILSIGVLAIEASKSSLLDVDHIEVTGAVEVPADVVLVTTGVRKGDALLGLDLATVRERLEALPWVLRARVTRHLPNRVEVTLEERTPAAFMARPEGGFTLLDGDARVLADRPDRPAGLPELMGAGPPPGPGLWIEAAAPAIAAVAALPPELQAQAISATVADGTVSLIVGGREVRFGAPDRLPAKAATLVALLAQLGDRPLAYIDVRVPSAPVVGPSGLPAGGPAGTAAGGTSPTERPKD